MKKRVLSIVMSVGMRKRIISGFLAVLMMLSFVFYVPTVKASAITQYDVSNQLSSLINTYANTTATDSVMYMGKQCKGFANWVFLKLFGVYIGPYPDAANYKITNPNAETIGIIEPGNLTESSSRELLQKALPGDYIQVQRSIAHSGGKCGPHSMIVVGVESDGVRVFDCNSDGRNTIKTYLYTWKDFDYQNRGMSLYRSWDYEASPVEKPSNVSISKNQNWFDIKDVITISTNATNASSYWMTIKKDGIAVVNSQMQGNSYTIAAQTLGFGEFKAFTTAINSAGLTNSEIIDIGVVREPGYHDIWSSKVIYSLDDTVSINVTTNCAKGQVIGIDRNGTRVITESCEPNYSIAASSLGVGDYSAYFSVFNGSGGIDTKRIEFAIRNTENLGGDFYAKIKNTATGKYLTNEDDNVAGHDGNCSKNQLWRFVRHADGSYKIISSADNKALDVYKSAQNGNGTNIIVYNDENSLNQKFGIYNVFGAYYFKTMCSDLFVDMGQNAPYNVEAWGGGARWAPQMFEIIKSDNVANHNLKKSATRPTCLTKGDEVLSCTNCDYMQVKVVPATGHSYGNWTKTKAATCTVGGTNQRVCGNNAGHKQTQNTEALGHSYSSSFTVDKPAVCGTGGSKSRHCTRCTAKTDVTAIPANGKHSFSQWRVDKQASCTEAGLKLRMCEACSKRETLTVSATGHRFGDWKQIKAPTNTAKGMEERVCSNDKNHKQTRELDYIKLENIRVSAKPKKLTYTYGESFSMTGLKLEAVYSNGAKKSLTSGFKTNIPDGYRFTSAGSKSISVSYTKGNITKKVSFTVTVKAKSIAKMTAQLSTAKYTYDGKLKNPQISVKNGSAVLREGRDYSVKYYNNIAVGKATAKIFGKGNYGGLIEKSFIINPASVKQLKASGKSTAVSLSWYKQPDIDGYEVYNAATNKPVAAVKGNNKHTVSKLTGNKAYSFKVRAYKYVGRTKLVGAFSPSVKVRTLPGSPKGLKITVAYTVNTTAKWDKQSGVSGYEIQYSQDKNFKSKVYKHTTSQNYYQKMYGLQSGKVFYFRVRSYVLSGGVKIYSAYSTVKGVKC